jgi:hypothetical protein
MQLRMKSHRWKKLDELQSDECRSHSDMINQRTMELAAASSSDATITNATDSYNESVAADSSVVEDVSCCSDDDGDNDAAVVVATSKIVPTTDDVHGSDSNGCIECNTPSNHSCRKCKKCVCSLCCAEKRELENAWWCDVCFKTQSVANQQLIRDGNYSSGDDDE